jgi:hypothetical protein
MSGVPYTPTHHGCHGFAMTMQDEDERREYYRIDDTIALEFTPLASPDVFDADAGRDDDPLFDLLGDLHVLDFESQHMLRHITERDRNLASYLKAINKRVDILGEAVARHMLSAQGAPQPVNLSEGGVSFSSELPVEIGGYLSLRLVLLPRPLGLRLRARVVHCAQQEDGRWEIGTEFDALPDAQRQLLARHILKKQAQERRLAREQPESDSR